MNNRMNKNFNIDVLKDIDFPGENNGEFASTLENDTISGSIRTNGAVTSSTISNRKARGGMVIFCFVCVMAVSSLYLEDSIATDVLFQIKDLVLLSEESTKTKTARRKSPFEKMKIPTRPQRYPFSSWDQIVGSQRTRNNQNEERNVVGQSNFFDKPLRILALGGSVTWGGVIRNKYDAYPFLLGQMHPKSTVDNMAIRASGANFPSGCIQSMIEGEAFPEYESLSKEEDRTTKVYDLILLEFSMNGIEGLDFLLYRLRTRFPNAILVYVHLRSPGRHSIKLEDQQLKDMMTPVNGIYYAMPPLEVIPDRSGQSYHLYGADRHHLSEVGHKFIAKGVVDLLRQNDPQIQELIRRNHQAANLGSWGGGDQCYFWMNSLGSFPSDLKAEGGRLNMFDSFLEKWAYEIDVGNHAQFSFDFKLNQNNQNTIRNTNTQKNSVPIFLVYMAKVSEMYFIKMMICVFYIQPPKLVPII